MEFHTYSIGAHFTGTSAPLFAGGDHHFQSGWSAALSRRPRRRLLRGPRPHGHADVRGEPCRANRRPVCRTLARAKPARD